MAGRRDDAVDICVGAGADVAELVDAASGWPAHIRVKVDDAWRDVALFAAPVGPSNRNFDHIERRFQNPGSNRPMVYPKGFTPLFLGIWRSDQFVEVPRTVVVSADVEHRAAAQTRFSVFPRLASLQEASQHGWAESVTTSGERLTYSWPSFISLVTQTAIEGVSISPEEITRATEAAGVTPGTSPEDAIERVRKLGSRLVRDAKFRNDVMEAYGSKCALCGLSADLVEAAHIYPASAPGSLDVVENGLALCRNHHRCFDRYEVWISPATGSVKFHPRLQSLAYVDDAVERFVSDSFDTLMLPADSGCQPNPEFFLKRYHHAQQFYAWVHD